MVWEWFPKKESPLPPDPSFTRTFFTPSDRRYIQHPWLGNRWYLPYVLSWRWRDSNVDIPWAPARWHSTIVKNRVIYTVTLINGRKWLHNWGYFTHRNGVTWAGPLLITWSGLVGCIINKSSHLAYLLHLHCILKLQMDIHWVWSPNSDPGMQDCCIS